MQLGAFSVSLAVKDIHASRTFYEKLGFLEVGGDVSQNWLILRNGETTIGLFQGMFERNALTFNPGWNSQAEEIDLVTDVREWQRHLREQGVELTMEVDPEGNGPGAIAMVDPDGNPVLIDQHV